MAEPPGQSPPSGYGMPYFDPADPLISAGYSGWWRRTVAVIARVWPQLLVLQVIGAVLIFLGDVAISRLVRVLVGESGEGAGPTAARYLTPVAAVLVESVLLNLMVLVVVYLVVLSAAGRQPTLGGCVHGAARRLLPLLGWSIPGGLITTVGFALCVLPGIYFFLVLTLLAPVVAVERGKAIGRCFELFHVRGGMGWGRMGTIVAISMLVGLLDTAVEVAVGPTLLSADTDANLPALALSSVVSAAAMILTGPLTVTAYAGLRAQREPTSTAVLTEQLLRH